MTLSTLPLSSAYPEHMQKEKVYSILLNSSRQDNKQYCKWNTAVNAKKVIASHGGGKVDKNIFL